jgi:anti-sigma regulatory factor (Ser/Thr protein kinase)
MASHELRVEPLVSEIPRLIEWLEARCGAEGITDDATLQIALAVEEAVSNVVNHAFAGLPPPYMIRVRLDIMDESVAVEIVDNGHPFDPTSAPDPDLTQPLEGRNPGGLGIHLIRGMVDRIQYRHSDGKNILRLEQARRR